MPSNKILTNKSVYGLERTDNRSSFSLRPLVECASLIPFYGLPATMAGLLFIAIVLPGKIWLTENFTLPGILSCLAFLAFLLSCLQWKRDTRRFWSRLLSALILGLLYLSIHGPSGLEDGWKRHITIDRPHELPASSVLSYVIYFIADFFALSNNQYISPFAGILAAFAYFKVLDALFVNKNDEENLIIAALLYFGSSLHLVFFRDFVSLTQLSVAPLLASLYFAIHYCRSTTKRSDYAIFLASGCLTIATLTHAENIFLFPAIPIIIFLRRLPRKQWYALAWETFGITALIVLLCFFTGLFATKMGFPITPGDAFGGGDGKTFVPFGPPQTSSERFSLLSVAHAKEMGNILLVLCPLFFLLPLIAFSSQYMKVFLQPENVMLATMTFGYLFFIFLYNFDLGYPRNIDLMLTMGTPFLLVCTLAIVRCVSGKLRWLLVGISIACSWMYISSFLEAGY